MRTRFLTSLLATSFMLSTFLLPSAGYAQVHIIEKGDTLWSIARKYYGDPKLYTLLLEFNPQNCMTRNIPTRTATIRST